MLYLLVSGTLGAAGFDADTAKSAPHTTNPRDGTETTSINSSERYESVSGINLKFLRNMDFAKKHNKMCLKNLSQCKHFII